MALGFFKKNNTADLILKNGRVLTQCADLPQAEAVACKDGRIIAVGDIQELEALVGSNTRIIDLEGRYAVPGFISLWEEPVLSAFDGCYLKLAGCTTKEELEERYPGSVSLSAGCCSLCRPEGCGRASGLACRYPQKMRYSIESLGGNVGLTVSKLMGIELEWVTEGRLPSYFVLVGGLLKRK